MFSILLHSVLTFDNLGRLGEIKLRRVPIHSFFVLYFKTWLCFIAITFLDICSDDYGNECMPLQVHIIVLLNTICKNGEVPSSIPQQFIASAIAAQTRVLVFEMSKGDKKVSML